MSEPADRLTRREAVAAVAALVGYLHGAPVDAAAPQVARANGGTVKGLSLDLTGFSAIVIRYGERVVTVTPVEVLDAIQGGVVLPPYTPSPSQMPMGQGAPAPRKY